MNYLMSRDIIECVVITKKKTLKQINVLQWIMHNAIHNKTIILPLVGKPGSEVYESFLRSRFISNYIKKKKC